MLATERFERSIADCGPRMLDHMKSAPNNPSNTRRQSDTDMNDRPRT